MTSEKNVALNQSLDHNCVEFVENILLVIPAFFADSLPRPTNSWFGCLCKRVPKQRSDQFKRNSSLF